MTIFDVNAGELVTLTTTRVGAMINGSTAVVEKEVEFTALATDDFERMDGVLRRRFISPSIQLVDGLDEVWLSNAPMSDCAMADTQAERWAF